MSKQVIKYLEGKLAEAVSDVNALHMAMDINADAYRALKEEASNLECLAINNKNLADQFRAEAQSATGRAISAEASLIKAESEVTRLTPYEDSMRVWKGRAISAEARLASVEKRATTNADDNLRLAAKVQQQQSKDLLAANKANGQLQHEVTRLTPYVDIAEDYKAALAKAKEEIWYLKKTIDKLNGEAYTLRAQIRNLGFVPDAPETSMS